MIIERLVWRAAYTPEAICLTSLRGDVLYPLQRRKKVYSKSTHQKEGWLWMKDSTAETTDNPWDELAQVFVASRHVSADKLIEWPAQLAAAGTFGGKCVLDVDCGTGDKARHFADHGAAYVLGEAPASANSGPCTPTAAILS